MLPPGISRIDREAEFALVASWRKSYERLRLVLGVATIGILALLTSKPGVAQDNPRAEANPGDELPEANPGRPTVSTPATLTPVGYLQIEAGVIGAERSGEFANRTGFNAVVKLSLTRRIELMALTEPVVVSDLGNRTDTNPGDVFAGLQAVIYHGEGMRPTVSGGYFRRLYSGRAPDFDIGSNRQGALILASFDVRKLHVDTNAIVAEQISDTGAHRAQFGQTLSLSHPLVRRFGVTGEIWHFSQPLINANAAGLLLAPTYTINRFLVIDAGFNRGLTTTSTRWAVFMGLTYLVPKRLW